MKNYFTTGLLIMMLFVQVSAQVAINTDGSAPNSSAMLDVQSSTRGMLAPCMTMVQRNAIASPATGLIVFQTDTIPGLYYNAGTPANPTWKLVGSNAGQWQNSGTGIYYNSGKVGVGTTAPSSNLDIEYGSYSGSYFGYSPPVSNYLFHSESPGNGDGQSCLYAFRSRLSSNHGTGYTVETCNTAMKGYSYWGDIYSFGTAGFNYNDYNRCGGILGSAAYGEYWGALGYKDSGANTYGGYFTSSLSGTGKSSQPTTGIGIGAWGDLMGADIHGKIFGVYAEGEHYAMFANGPVYKNNLDVHLQENSNGSESILYTNVSTDVTIQTSGIARLTSGKATIEFDAAFTASLTETEPVIVTVTPMGKSNGVYLASVTKTGFEVEENKDGASNVNISYIAIGKRSGYEHPRLDPDVVSSGYVQKMKSGLHNDADCQTNGKGFCYENNRLTVGIRPSIPDPNKKQMDPLRKTRSE